MDDKARDIIEDLSLVYWKEINESDSLYVEAIERLRELCDKYGVTYNSSVQQIFSNILNGNECGSYENLLGDLKKDLETCHDEAVLGQRLRKYESLHDAWRNLIYGYVGNYGQLFDILNGEMENTTKFISEVLPRDVRLMPRQKFLYDDYGWPIVDDNDNFVTELESESDVLARVASEDLKYEQMVQRLADMKASLPRWMEYLIVLPELSSIYKTIGDSLFKFGAMKDKFILDDFNKDLEFMAKLDDIMAHDKSECEYLYHGTTCVDDAMSILKEGLYMRSDDLGSTTYSEFSRDALLLYSRGFFGEVGSSAVVIIKKPHEVDIVREVTESERASCHIVPSGLGGLDCDPDYIIPREYIVGYVDKNDREVVWQKEFSLDDHVSASK